MTEQTYAYGVRWRYERAHGITRTVDATWAVERVQALQAEGHSLRGIADAAGLSVSIVARLARNEPTKVNVRTVAALQTVTAEGLRNRSRGDAFVLSIGSRRRIQCLLALGYRHSDITATMRATTPGLGQSSQVVLHQIGGWISRRTADAIAATYDQLAMTPGPSATTRARAARNGYLPPLAWDDEDIDDPYGEPDTSARIEDRAPDRKTKLPPVDELRWLLDTAGESIAAIASRFGVSEDGVSKALGRTPAA